MQLDRLGGAAWQARKARVKQRMRDMADELIRIAAERRLRPGDRRSSRRPGLYDEFCARFPYPETEDQLRAIDEVLEDLASGRPMDRLICGDVGFGKTEVALRAAFVAAMTGKQVAVVVPTTLLARQHSRPSPSASRACRCKIAQLSRLVAAKEAGETQGGARRRARSTSSSAPMRCSAKSIEFKHLGLVIVDEEQHFGVKHKERLKQLRADVHVLTLTATPIPRTLQMALSGVREMRIIATPPVDRLAVRTYVLPCDPVVVREALLREQYRGGQSLLRLPAHRGPADDGRAPARAGARGQVRRRPRPAWRRPSWRTVMTAFYDGKYRRAAVDQHRRIRPRHPDRQHADHPPRRHVRAGPALPAPRPDRALEGARLRLSDRAARTRCSAAAAEAPAGGACRRWTAWAPASSWPATISTSAAPATCWATSSRATSARSASSSTSRCWRTRSPAARGGRGGARAREEAWSPQINVGTPVLIPESYVADLSVRLGLYRRIAALVDRAEIDAFAAELIDRFGPLPDEVENLLQIVAIKRLCREAGVERVDAGPKGAVLSFYENRFAKPEKLIAYIGRESTTVSLRPDHRLVVRRAWEKPEARVRGVHDLMQELARLAA